MQELLQYLFSGITNGAVYAVIALGFSMLYSSTGLINFAHGEFVMVGALSLPKMKDHGSGRFRLPMVCLYLLQVQTTCSTGRHSKREAAKKEEAKVEEPITHNHS